MPASISNIGSAIKGLYNGLWYAAELVKKHVFKQKTKPVAKTEVVEEAKDHSVVLGLLTAGNIISGFFRSIPIIGIGLAIFENRRRRADADAKKAAYRAILAPYEAQLEHVGRLKEEYNTQLKYIEHLKKQQADPQSIVQAIEVERVRVQELRKILILEQVRAEELREKTEAPVKKARETMEAARTAAMWGKINIGVAIFATILGPYSLFASVGLGLGTWVAEKLWRKEDRKALVDTVKKVPEYTKAALKKTASTIGAAFNSIRNLFTKKAVPTIVELGSIDVREAPVNASHVAAPQATSQAVISRRLSENATSAPVVVAPVARNEEGLKLKEIIAENTNLRSATPENTAPVLQETLLIKQTLFTNSKKIPGFRMDETPVHSLRAAPAA